MGTRQLSSQLSRSQGADTINLVRIFPAHRPPADGDLRSVMVGDEFLARMAIVALGTALFEIAGPVQDQVFRCERFAESLEPGGFLNVSANRGQYREEDAVLVLVIDPGNVLNAQGQPSARSRYPRRFHHWLE